MTNSPEPDQGPVAPTEPSSPESPSPGTSPADSLQPGRPHPTSPYGESSYDTAPYGEGAFDDGAYPDPSSSAELTPPTNGRQVVAGVAPPVSAILSWILATARHNNLWYTILVAVTGLSAALFASATDAAERRRQR